MPTIALYPMLRVTLRNLPYQCLLMAVGVDASEIDLSLCMQFQVFISNNIFTQPCVCMISLLGKLGKDHPIYRHA